MIHPHYYPPKSLLGIPDSLHFVLHSKFNSLQPLAKGSSSLPLHIQTGQSGADQKMVLFARSLPKVMAVNRISPLENGISSH